MIKFNPEIHKRKSIRLKEYDYSSIGMYFITICTQNRQKILSKIKKKYNKKDYDIYLELTKIGEIIYNYWYKTEKIYNNIKLRDFIIMPNHIHGIIEITEEGGQSRPPLQKIIQGFKSVTTRECYKYGYNKIWQRNYYEHIIRNEKEYYSICEYIRNNPYNWDEDKYNC